MKKIMVLLLVISTVFFSCNFNELQIEEHSDIKKTDDMKELYFKALASEDLTLNGASTTRGANENIQPLTEEETLMNYVDNEFLRMFYIEIINIIENENYSIEETISELNNFVETLKYLPENDFENIQRFAAIAGYTLEFYGKTECESNRGLGSWLRSKKSRIINASISACCGALIGSAFGAGVSSYIPGIGTVTGAVGGAVAYGSYCAKSGWDKDAVYIWSGRISI